MSHCKELVRNINKGKNLDENIPAYRDLLFDIYNQASLLHITMEYFVLYESLQEKQIVKIANAGNINKPIASLFPRYFFM